MPDLVFSPLVNDMNVVNDCSLKERKGDNKFLHKGNLSTDLAMKMRTDQLTKAKVR